MNRDELIAIGKLSVARLCADEPSSKEVPRLVIRTTSGTTKTSPLVMALRYPLREYLAFENIKRPVVCMGSMGVCLTNVLATRYSVGGGVRQVLVLDVKDIEAPVGGLIDDFMPDAFRGTPSFVSDGIQILSPTARTHLRYLLLVGEPMTDLRQRFFKECAPKAVIQMSYATSELGPISKSGCPYVRINQYHPRDDITIGLENPDESGAGDLVVSMTLFDKHIVRYRIGDIARLLPPCLCGEPVAFEIIGRAGYDYIKLAGAILRREEFDRVIQMFPYIDDYRVEARETPVGGVFKGSIVLMFYHRGGPITDALLKELQVKVSRELFLTPTQTLADLAKQGIFLPLTVVQTKEPFTQKNKDVKLFRV